MALSSKEVKKLFDYARKSIGLTFKRKKFVPKKVPESLRVKRGVFVTLETYPDKSLRGCIGFIEPVTLFQGVIDAARSSAFNDPRFPMLNEKELDHVIVEISILTPAKEIKFIDSRELLDKISKGDGLILEKGYNKGLFLPQVWDKVPDKKRFLDELCLKAGLPYGAWISPEVRVYKFKVKAWVENKPKGSIKRV